jgi:RNA polymerase sigma-70 factor (ECF subfamily)
VASDEALYERLIEGDLGAFDELYRRYERPLFGFILRMLPDRQEAEEVFHESFLALLREREGRHTIRSFRAWLYGTTRNQCLNRLRGRRRSARAMAAVASAPAAPAEGPEGALLRREAAEALRRAVSRLPTSLAELYALRARGLSYEELAEVLGVPQGTVKSRVHTMVSRLREEMRA